MSNITDIVSSAQGGQLVDNLALRFGLSHEQMDAAVKALISALAIGLQNAARNPNSLQHVIAAVAQPTHYSAFENPDAAYAEENIANGRDVVEHLFGSSAAAGQVAQLASRESGVRPDILQQLLPILAPIILGGLFKSLKNKGLDGILGSLASSGALGSVLGNLTGAGAPSGGAAAPAPRKGLLGGLLGLLLGALLGRRGPAPAPAAPPPASPLPGGFDRATLEAVLEQIKNAFQPGAVANVNHNAELEDVLSKVFGPSK